MPAVQRQTSLLHEVAHAIHSVGQALRSMFAAEPAPHWADYLHQERNKNS